MPFRVFFYSILLYSTFRLSYGVKAVHFLCNLLLLVCLAGVLQICSLAAGLTFTSLPPLTLSRTFWFVCVFFCARALPLRSAPLFLL